MGVRRVTTIQEFWPILVAMTVCATLPAGWVFYVAIRTLNRQAEAWRRQVERLERMLVARDLGEAVAMEKLIDGGNAKDEPAPAGAEDEFWRGPVRPKPREDT